MTALKSLQSGQKIEYFYKQLVHFLGSNVGTEFQHENPNASFFFKRRKQHSVHRVNVRDKFIAGRLREKMCLVAKPPRAIKLMKFEMNSISRKIIMIYNLHLRLHVLFLIYCRYAKAYTQTRRNIKAVLTPMCALRVSLEVCLFFLRSCILSFPMQ